MGASGAGVAVADSHGAHPVRGSVSGKVSGDAPGPSASAASAPAPAPTPAPAPAPSLGSSVAAASLSKALEKIAPAHDRAAKSPESSAEKEAMERLQVRRDLLALRVVEVGDVQRGCDLTCTHVCRHVRPGRGIGSVVT